MTTQQHIEARAAELFREKYEGKVSPLTLQGIRTWARISPSASAVWAACLDAAARELYPTENERGEG